MLCQQEEKTLLNVRVSYPYDDRLHIFYQTHQCEIPNVYEALASEVEYWEPRNPVLINAPTGMGKTTFVYKKLIPMVLESGKNLLLISNRLALSAQQKNNIMDILHHPYCGGVSPSVLRQMENFGQVRVLTYHRLPELIRNTENNGWIENLGFVVADEIHFLAADSSFNERCDYYLKILTTKFKHAIRIYLTATDWDVQTALAEAEESNCNNISETYFALINNTFLERRHFYRYYFPASYNHVNLSFFQDFEEIFQLIEGNIKEKWLVFVDRKTKGLKIAEKLGRKASYIDSTTKDSKQWDEILSEQRFRTQVLITTSVLDCGVNIIDDSLRNVVVFTDNRVSLIQMLGRKRCKPKEKINLYVYQLDGKTIGKRLNAAYTLFQLEKDYDLQMELPNTWSKRKTVGRMAVNLWNVSEEVLRKYFILGTDMRLRKNQLAFYTLHRRVRFYESLVNPENDFPAAVCEWLGYPAQEDDPVTKLRNYCERMEGIVLSSADLDELRTMAIKAAAHCGFKEPHPLRNEKLGRDAIANRIKIAKVNYILNRDCMLVLEEEDEAAP